MNVDPNQPDPQDASPIDAELPEPLPPQLLNALRRAERIDDLPTDALDRAVLEASRSHFAEINRHGRLRRFFAIGGAGAALATAAAVAIVVLIGDPFGNVTPNGDMASNIQNEPAVDQEIIPDADFRETLPNDFNNDGKVDVGDALQLAKALQRGNTPPGSDLNGDGQFTQADIDLFLQQRVSLNLTVTQREDAKPAWYAFVQYPERRPETTSGGGS